MKKVTLILSFVSICALTAFTALPPAKLVAKDAHISFYSHTAVEDITANNYKVTTTLDTDTGELVFSVPMQGFEFEKALMQKHYNSKNFLNTKKYPKAKFVGKITNMGAVDLDTDGSYTAQISGEMTIKETTQNFESTAAITVASSQINLESKMDIVLADYGVTFSKGKPSTNIAKEIEVTVKANYKP